MVWLFWEKSVSVQLLCYNQNFINVVIKERKGFG